jgi:rhamnulokinase
MTNGGAVHLGIDLGASSGRVFLGQRSGNTLNLSEVHRFPNEPLDNGHSCHWDVARLWAEVRSALARAEGPRIESVGVDAWGVDYALLGERGELLQNPYHYRDPRNVSAMSEVLALVPKEEIYRQTGIQFMPINTLNQLFAAERDTPELLAAAHRLIMIPDLFHYWLTGNAVCEYTAASTTQFANPVSRNWARELLRMLNLPDQLPAEIVEPGTIVGHVMPEVAPGAVSGVPVIAPASHDTASAVAAVEARGSAAFLSSGTWSLIGTELDSPLLTADALRMNFTNEGGVCGTTRVLKNVMGLWMLQSCRRQWAARGQHFSYGELVAAARQQPAFGSLVDPDDSSFLNPGDMLAAIDEFCARTDQLPPASPPAYVRLILESLALKYRLVIRDLEALIGRQIKLIRVIGGGSNNQLLNQFTADASGKRTVAGPAEAAVLGNIGVQMISTGAVASLKEMRAMIDRSFPPGIFDPQDPVSWDNQAGRFRQYCKFSYA